MTRLRLRDGRDLAYTLHGPDEGAPLLWLHGAPSGRGEGSFHAGAARQLGLRICAVDRPGMGESSRAPRPGLRSFAEDLAQLTDALGWRRFVVAGASGGGPYALALAAVRGERVVHALILAGAGQLAEDARAAGWVDRLTGALLRRAPVVVAAWLHAIRLVARLGAGLPGTLGSAASVTADALAPGISGALDDLRVLHAPWDVRLGTIAVPVTFVHGDRDAFVPFRHAEALARAVPGSRLVRRRGRGHVAVSLDLPGALDAAGLRRPAPPSAMVWPP